MKIINFIGYKIEVSETDCLLNKGRKIARIQSTDEQAINSLKLLAIFDYMMDHIELRRLISYRLITKAARENEYLDFVTHLAEKGHEIPSEITSGQSDNENWGIFFNNQPIQLSWKDISNLTK